MTFGRALITAAMSAFFTQCHDFAECAAVVGAGLLCWQFTSDPLPDAINKGILDAAQRWRGR